jgi:hypothetical protein
MSKHTPGPWKLNKEERSFHVCFNHGAGLCEIALVEPVETRAGVVLISDEQAEANARLIAAAPEMEKALRLAWAVLIQAGIDHGIAFKAVEDAIAKTEIEG